MSETNNGFNNVTSLIRNCTTFVEARKIARTEFIRQFQDLNENIQQNYTRELFQWAMNRLHSREVYDRIAALTGLAFYLNFVDKDQDLQNLVTQLERILPAENVCVIEGIAYIFEHIYRKISTPFLPRLFERCASWISTRPTPHAVLSSAILMKKLYFCTSSNSQKTNQYLTTVMNAAFRFDNQQAQSIAVDLYLMGLSRDPSVDESTRLYINDCTVAFGSRSNQESSRAHVHGCLLLLQALILNQRRVTLQRFHEFFPVFLHYLQNSKDSSLISFIAFFCEQNIEGSRKYSDEIFSIIKDNCIDYSQQDTCSSLCRLIQCFPDDLSRFGFSVAKTMREKATQRFYDITESILKAKHSEVDPDVVFQVFTKSNTLTQSLLNAMEQFLIHFPRYQFRVIAQIHPKIRNCLNDTLNETNVLDGLLALQVFSQYIQFNVDSYWEMCKQYMVNKNEDVRIAAIKSLFAISCHDTYKINRDVVLHVFYIGANDESKKVRKSICEFFPDDLLCIFSEIELVSLVEQFVDDRSSKVAEQAIKLTGRIRQKYPLNVINIFWSRLSRVDVDYSHTDLINERKRMIMRLPWLVGEAGEFAVPLHRQIIKFIKTLLQNQPPQNITLSEKMNQHRDEKCDRIIRLSCMRTIAIIGHYLADICDEIAELTEIVLSQLYVNSHPNFQIIVANTLKQIFRCVDVIHNTELNTLDFQMKMMRFVQSTDNPGVINAFIRLFGTIGPLDPFRFHQSQNNTTNFDSSLICHPSKREKCYLDFVMGYIISQLQSKSRNHEPTTLINAIVYIFQSDAKNCKHYLDEILLIFVDLFREKNCPTESLFSFLRSIIILVDVEILNSTEPIMKIINDFLPTGKSLGAVKSLNAVIYSLKSCFQKTGSETFKTVINVLDSKEKVSPEIRGSLLLTLTLLTIYTGGYSSEFFKHIQKAALAKDSNTPYAFMYLTQSIAAGAVKQLVLPSLKLAISQVVGASTPQYVIELLYVLIAKYPDTVLTMPIKLTGISPMLDSLIEDCKAKKHIDLDSCPFAAKLKPIPDPSGIRPKTPFESKSIMSMFQQGRFMSSASENNWTAWALNFAQELALCSRSPAIRACLPLLMSSTSLHLSIFPLIFLSVWENAQDDERQMLSSYIRQVVSQNVPQNILQLVSATCEELDRAGFDLFPDEPLLAGQISERCNSWFRALRFYAAPSPAASDAISHLLRIETQLKRKECALGLQQLAHCTNCELLESLNMWSDTRDIYMKKFEENGRNESYLIGILKCSLPMDDWQVIIDRFPDFPSYSKEMQAELGTIFGAAAISTGRDENPFLDAVTEDTPQFCYWRTISAIHHKKFDEARMWIRRGRSYLVRNNEIFASGNYEPAIPTITNSMMFEELEDVVDSHTQPHFDDVHVLELWHRKLDYLRRDPTWLRTIYRERALLNTDAENVLNMSLYFFNSLRRQNEWDLYDRLVKDKLPKDDPRVRILQAKVNYDRGIRKDDLSDFVSLIEELKKQPSKADIFCQAVCSYASRTRDMQQALEFLKDVILIQPSNTHAWKYYAYTNLKLSEDSQFDKEIFANNAMTGFVSLIDLKQPFMHYLCQLCSLFFNYGTRLRDFASASQHLINLPPENVLKIMPQLLTQFSHPIKEVRDVVFQIIDKLAESNYQSLAFSLSLIRNLGAKGELLALIDKIEAKNVQISSDLKGFSESMIYMAVLPIDRFIEISSRLLTVEKTLCLKFGSTPASKSQQAELLRQIMPIVDELIKFQNQPFPSFNGDLFNSKSFTNYFAKLKQLRSSKDPDSLVSLVLSLTKNMNTMARNALEKVTSVNIKEMGVRLSSKNELSIVVPGTQSIGHSVVTIQKVNNVMKTIPSAQHPRKMTLIGTDGNTYTYLLKGGEDLRLDQHVMQFFSLINSILKEDKFGDDIHCTIMQYDITPLSSEAGLISWATGGKTLYNMIKWYRKLRGFNVSAEQPIYTEFCQNSKEQVLDMTRLQRLELYERLCSVSTPDHLRQVLWFKSPSAESWLLQSTNFARSTSLMSFVGYIIGLGDRHPSNILVMEHLGNVVHIDLSDCFEKASLRRYAQETVPFRLTRMVLDSLGPSKVHGVFSFTAECVMNAMKRNQSTLLAFLDIFTKENVIDVMWYSSEKDEALSETEKKNTLFKRAIERVSDKLNFREFGEPENVATAEHISKLISIATDPMNLAQMYYGWSAFW